MAKPGPKTDNPKVEDFRIRFTKEEKEILDYCAEKSNQTKATIVRLGILEIYQKIKKEEK